MSTWEQRVAEANDEAGRRRLLGELGGWRARNLGDVLVQREAARVMASLYALLGDNPAAVREAESLVSLCQTHPKSGARELREAQALAKSLGGGGVVGPRSAAEPRGRKPKKPSAEPAPADDRLSEARSAFAAGDLDAARRSLRRKKGQPAALLKAAVWVEEIRQADPADRDASLERLAEWLRRLVVGGTEEKNDEPAAKRVTKEASPPVAESPLGALLGEAVPSRRRALIRLLEKASSRMPDRVGDLAVAALDHHVAAEGADAPAPWLVGLMAAAVVAGQGEGPLARIAELRAQGAAATVAYSEWAWTAALDLMSTVDQGDYDGLRRGVLARGGEPESRKVWTLRLSRGAEQALVALAAPSEGAYPQEFAEAVVARIASLATGALLVAPGEGNAALRDAAAAIGLATVDSTEPGDWSAALVWGASEASTEKATPKPARKPAPAVDRDAVLLEALGNDTVSAEALEPMVGAYGRLHHAFVAIRSADLSEGAVLAFLEAVHRVAPEKARLPEGTSLAVRLAAGGSDAAVTLLQEGPASQRYGGEGIAAVVEAARAMGASGVELERAVRGPMARERRQDPVISALGDGADAVWRLEGSRGETKVQIALVTVDSPEARAGLPRLWSRSAAVLVPEEAMAWCAALEGAPPVFCELAQAVAAITSA